MNALFPRIAALLVLLTFSFLQSNSVFAASPDPNLPALRAQADEKGLVRLMVRLGAPFQLESQLGTETAVSAQRAAIQQTQDALLQRLAGQKLLAVRRFQFIPYLALTTDRRGLDALAAAPQNVGLYPDTETQPSLFASLPLIGAPVMWGAGATGKGQTIAVLDTGVDRHHVFLAGRVLSEACYSSSVPGLIGSFCPNGVATSTAPDSGMPCPEFIINQACQHGTHVAGIVAGQPSVIDVPVYGDQTIAGVAPDSTLIAIQVFSHILATNSASAFVSDQIAGLERVYELRHQYNIAAVNLSLGGGKYAEHCDAQVPFYKDMLDTLRGANIAALIATGNDSYTDGIAFPACISSAIAVGSSDTIVAQEFQVDDGVQDWVSKFTNRNQLVTLLAPGNFIISSVPGDTFGFKAGTSMATPTVAGAWAALKSAAPNATVDEILRALVVTGKPIPDWRVLGPSWVKPRIQVDKALFELAGCASAPRAPRLLEPADGAMVSGGTATLVWSSRVCATSYRVIVNRGAPPFKKVLRATVNTRTFTTPALAPGTYSWRIRACSELGCKMSGWRSFIIP